MKHITHHILSFLCPKNIRHEEGYTLLEYCAGAAIMAGVVWGAMQLLGTNLQNFLTTLAGWAADRAGDIQ
ncbi:MAG: hypothetical protein KDD62_11705 [Bdellovibrionales bacterium]|nr:hypothetical protein [Bdellovibrionales bacterium]